MLKIDPNLQQRQASNPDASIWVNASAGSGKTKILTDRFLRLLLNKTLPHKILCLTFTKAAATEMSNRIFERTKKWAICAEDVLQEELNSLTGDIFISKEKLSFARSLFARILDVSGGLRIQTIHSFCQSVLRRFPLEASVSPHFQAIDERGAHEIYMQLMHKLMHARLQNMLSKDLTESFDHLTLHLSEHRFIEMGEKILQKRSKFTFLSQDLPLDQMRALFATQLSFSKEALLKNFEEDSMRDQRKKVKEILIIFRDLRLSERDQDKVLQLNTLTDQENDEDFMLFFLTLKGEIRKTIFTKKTYDQHCDLKPLIEQAAQKAYDFNQFRKKKQLLEDSAYFLCFAKWLLTAYQKEKQEKGVLDYDDLIFQTANLLKNSDMVSWVLFKLDGGIDHLLVDEAQDTSASQWQVIKALVEDFYAGFSAQEKNRTLFVVGDEKQSIFSFQGADPSLFTDIHRFFEQRAKQAHSPWENVNLQVSFRSTQQILSFVDSVFASELSRAGVSLSGEPIQHYAFRSDNHGSIELWPLLLPEEEENSDGENWDISLQQKFQMLPERVLAEEIACHIENRLQNQEYIASKKRAIRPGDIMILLRKRSKFLFQIVRALKKKNLPMTGVDRMVLTEQLVVKDLLAFIDWVLCPENDLVLATILKSPLIGMSEDDLYVLCRDRQTSLWEKLKNQMTEISSYLSMLIEKSVNASAFELLSFILRTPCPNDPHSARRAIYKRLSLEVEDAMNELLAVALSYDRTHTHSLQNFLHWMQENDSEIKREMEQIEDRIRIMTSHGSKGLQAPIVYLPDTMSSATKGEIFYLDDSTQNFPLFPISTTQDIENIKVLKDARKEKEQEEYRRLLYVALTRAEDSLVICGARGQKEIKEPGWYDYCREAIIKTGKSKKFTPFLSIGNWQDDQSYLLQNHDQEKLTIDAVSEQTSLPSFHELPDWAHQKIIPQQQARHILKPSIAQQKSFALDDDGQATPLLLRGKILHEAFEYLPLLPQDKWSNFIAKLCQKYHAESSIEFEADLLHECQKIILNPDFSDLFSQEAKAEIPVLGHLSSQKNTYISGQIDRILIREKDILLVDFKTSPKVPSSKDHIPKHILTQMGYYQKLLQDIYPDKEIKSAILWTARPCLMFL